MIWSSANHLTSITTRLPFHSSDCSFLPFLGSASFNHIKITLHCIVSIWISFWIQLFTRKSHPLALLRWYFRCFNCTSGQQCLFKQKLNSKSNFNRSNWPVSNIFALFSSFFVVVLSFQSYFHFQSWSFNQHYRKRKRTEK